MRIVRYGKEIRINQYLWRIMAIMLACTILYYLPVITGALGWESAQDSLALVHDFYGIDFYGILFFVPVVYAAYTLGVVPGLLTALIAMLVLLPHAILIDTYPSALFKPTAFVIILSAVGAAVAMLQKSEQEHRQRMKEMKCLYDIGKAAQESPYVENFLARVADLIPLSMQYPEETGVKIVFRDGVFLSSKFQKYRAKITEDLVVGGEKLGYVAIYSYRENPYLKKRNHLTKTLAERISGAIRELELEQYLQSYYEQLEDEVESRTRDLEQVQERLIRSERLAAVGELASGVGHELRNPLNVMKNCVYLLKITLADNNNEETLNTLGMLDKQIDVSNRIVTDLLDFTRIKKPAKTVVEIDNLVRESLAGVAVPDGVTVTADLNGNSPRISTDVEQVGRAFTNIISNAFQAMNGSGGKLKVGTGTADGYAWARFEDNGCGIPEENLEKIFEPLFTTKPKGIGLGLAISRRLVEQNGGRMEVSSRVKQGTVFTVKLPVHKRRKEPL